MALPAGTPKEVVDALSGAIKRAMDTDEFKSKVGGMGRAIRYLDPVQFGKYWDEIEAVNKHLMQEMGAQ